MRTLLIVILISLFFSIVGLVVGGVTYKYDVLPDYNTLQKCTNDQDKICKETCCLIWDADTNTCMRGHKKDNSCEPQNNALSFSFGIVGLAFVIVFVISLIMLMVEYFLGKKTTFHMSNSVYRYQ